MTSSWHFRISFGLLLGTVAVSGLTARRDAQPLAQPLATIADRIGEWVGTDDPPLPDRVTGSLAATSYLSRTYRNGSKEMNLFIAFYANQRAGESMHSPKYCMPGGGWELMDSGNTAVLSNNRRIDVNNYMLYRNGDRMRMLYWYQGPHRVVASEYKAKLYLLWDAVRTGQTAGSIVRITAPDAPGALEQALGFATKAISQVDRCFGGT
jgi:EpsI family protein